MKRTPEIIIGIIGTILYGLTAALGGSMIMLQNNRELLEESVNGAIEQNPGIAMGDMEAVIESFSTGGWMLIGSSVFAIVLGIIAMIIVKGNKKPLLAGIIFLAAAAIVTIVTIGVGILPSIFYLVASVMCFVRKPKVVLENTKMLES